MTNNMNKAWPLHMGLLLILNMVARRLEFVEYLTLVVLGSSILFPDIWGSFGLESASRPMV